MSKNYKEIFSQITTLALDVDGVLTNGQLVLMPDGNQLRSMNIKDGYAMQHAIKKGFKIIIISGANGPAVETRMNRLGITDVFMGVVDKAAVLREYCNRHQINLDHVACMGDDIPDINMLNISGLPCCPLDAVSEVKAVSKYIVNVNGGEGCVRILIEQIMKTQGRWE